MLNKSFYLILIISIVFATSFWFGFNVNLLQVEAIINAPIYDELFKILFIIGLIIFIGMTIAVIYSLFKFRKRNNQIGDGIALEGNLSLEIIWTIIPSIIVLLKFNLTLVTLNLPIQSVFTFPYLINCVAV